ncbi:MAG TPA: hypothetical protein VGR88_02425, partial [Ktedonobacterales bacterium]|nr:hypothetical protein [Ktedonobacterales bacterium]
MARTVYRPETDGFAFVNHWTFDDYEKQVVEQTVAELLPIAEVIASPILIPLITPFVVAECVALGPFAFLAVDAEVKAINSGIVNGISSAITAGSYGLCGGMTFASLDYWLQQWIVPRGNGRDDQPSRATTQGTVLRDYIWSRLLDSIQDNGATFITWVIMANAPFGAGHSWLKSQTSTEFQNIKAGIDSGTPVPIGLIGTTSNPLNDHQVLCYGYQDNLDGTGSLFLYDNNRPGVESQIDFDLRGDQVVATRDDTFVNPDRGPLCGFFATVYSQKTPPKAVVLNRSVAILPSCVQEQLPFEVTYSALNVGYHDSPAMELVVMSGSDELGGETAPTALAEGSARALDTQIMVSGAGWRTLSVLADLGTVASIHILKQLPPADTNIVGSAHVNVLPALRIRLQPPAANNPCSVFFSEEAGATATFAVDPSTPAPPGGSYQWRTLGATGLANTGPTFQAQMPATVGTWVTVSVVITYNNGCRRGGSLTVSTFSHLIAMVESAFCNFHNSVISMVVGHLPPPPKERPGSPIPVVGVLTQQNLAALQHATAELMRGLNAALGSGAGGEVMNSPAYVGGAPLRVGASPEVTVIVPMSSGSATGLLRLPSGRSVSITADRVEIGRGITNT